MNPNSKLKIIDSKLNTKPTATSNINKTPITPKSNQNNQSNIKTSNLAKSPTKKQNNTSMVSSNNINTNRDSKLNSTSKQISEIKEENESEKQKSGKNLKVNTKTDSKNKIFSKNIMNENNTPKINSTNNSNLKTKSPNAVNAIGLNNKSTISKQRTPRNTNNANTPSTNLLNPTDSGKSKKVVIKDSPVILGSGNNGNNDNNVSSLESPRKINMNKSNKKIDKKLNLDFIRQPSLNQTDNLNSSSRGVSKKTGSKNVTNSIIEEKEKGTKTGNISNTMRSKNQSGQNKQKTSNNNLLSVGKPSNLNLKNRNSFNQNSPAANSQRSDIAKKKKDGPKPRKKQQLISKQSNKQIDNIPVFKVSNEDDINNKNKKYEFQDHFPLIDIKTENRKKIPISIKSSSISKIFQLISQKYNENRNNNSIEKHILDHTNIYDRVYIKLVDGIKFIKVDGKVNNRKLWINFLNRQKAHVEILTKEQEEEKNQKINQNILEKTQIYCVLFGDHAETDDKSKDDLPRKLLYKNSFRKIYKYMDLADLDDIIDLMIVKILDIKYYDMIERKRIMAIRRNIISKINYYSINIPKKPIKDEDNVISVNLGQKISNNLLVLKDPLSNNIIKENKIKKKTQALTKPLTKSIKNKATNNLNNKFNNRNKSGFKSTDRSLSFSSVGSEDKGNKKMNYFGELTQEDDKDYNLFQKKSILKIFSYMGKNSATIKSIPSFNLKTINSKYLFPENIEDFIYEYANFEVDGDDSNYNLAILEYKVFLGKIIRFDNNIKPESKIFTLPTINKDCLNQAESAVTEWMLYDALAERFDYYDASGQLKTLRVISRNPYNESSTIENTQIDLKPNTKKYAMKNIMDLNLGDSEDEEESNSDDNSISEKDDEFNSSNENDKENKALDENNISKKEESLKSDNEENIKENAKYSLNIQLVENKTKNENRCDTKNLELLSISNKNTGNIFRSPKKTTNLLSPNRNTNNLIKSKDRKVYFNPSSNKNKDEANSSYKQSVKDTASRGDRKSSFKQQMSTQKNLSKILKMHNRDITAVQKNIFRLVEKEINGITLPHKISVNHKDEPKSDSETEESEIKYPEEVKPVTGTKFKIKRTNIIDLLGVVSKTFINSLWNFSIEEKNILNNSKNASSNLKELDAIKENTAEDFYLVKYNSEITMKKRSTILINNESYDINNETSSDENEVQIMSNNISYKWFLENNIEILETFDKEKILYYKLNNNTFIEKEDEENERKKIYNIFNAKSQENGNNNNKNEVGDEDKNTWKLVNIIKALDPKTSKEIIRKVLFGNKKEEKIKNEEDLDNDNSVENKGNNFLINLKNMRHKKNDINQIAETGILPPKIQKIDERINNEEKLNNKLLKFSFMNTTFSNIKPKANEHYLTIKKFLAEKSKYVDDRDNGEVDEEANKEDIEEEKYISKNKDNKNTSNTNTPDASSNIVNSKLKLSTKTNLILSNKILNEASSPKLQKNKTVFNRLSQLRKLKEERLKEMEIERELENKKEQEREEEEKKELEKKEDSRKELEREEASNNEINNESEQEKIKTDNDTSKNAENQEINLEGIKEDIIIEGKDIVKDNNETKETSKEVVTTTLKTESSVPKSRFLLFPEDLIKINNKIKEQENINNKANQLKHIQTPNSNNANNENGKTKSIINDQNKTAFNNTDTKFSDTFMNGNNKDCLEAKENMYLSNVTKPKKAEVIYQIGDFSVTQYLEYNKEKRELELKKQIKLMKKLIMYPPRYGLRQVIEYDYTKNLLNNNSLVRSSLVSSVTNSKNYYDYVFGGNKNNNANTNANNEINLNCEKRMEEFVEIREYKLNDCFNILDGIHKYESKRDFNESSNEQMNNNGEKTEDNKDIIKNIEDTNEDTDKSKVLDFTISKLLNLKQLSKVNNRINKFLLKITRINKNNNIEIIVNYREMNEEDKSFLYNVNKEWIDFPFVFIKDPSYYYLNTFDNIAFLTRNLSEQQLDGSTNILDLKEKLQMLEEKGQFKNLSHLLNKKSKNNTGNIYKNSYLTKELGDAKTKMHKRTKSNLLFDRNNEDYFNDDIFNLDKKDKAEESNNEEDDKKNNDNTNSNKSNNNNDSKVNDEQEKENLLNQLKLNLQESLKHLKMNLQKVRLVKFIGDFQQDSLNNETLKKENNYKADYNAKNKNHNLPTLDFNTNQEFFEIRETQNYFSLTKELIFVKIKQTSLLFKGTSIDFNNITNYLIEELFKLTSSVKYRGVKYFDEVVSLEENTPFFLNDKNNKLSILQQINCKEGDDLEPYIYKEDKGLDIDKKHHSEANLFFNKKNNTAQFFDKKQSSRASEDPLRNEKKHSSTDKSTVPPPIQLQMLKQSSSAFFHLPNNESIGNELELVQKRVSMFYLNNRYKSLTKSHGSKYMSKKLGKNLNDVDENMMIDNYESDENSSHYNTDSISSTSSDDSLSDTIAENESEEEFSNKSDDSSELINKESKKSLNKIICKESKEANNTEKMINLTNNSLSPIKKKYNADFNINIDNNIIKLDKIDNESSVTSNKDNEENNKLILKKSSKNLISNRNKVSQQEKELEQNHTERSLRSNNEIETSRSIHKTQHKSFNTDNLNNQLKDKFEHKSFSENINKILDKINKKRRESLNDQLSNFKNSSNYNSRISNLTKNINKMTNNISVIPNNTSLNTNNLLNLTNTGNLFNFNNNTNNITKNLVNSFTMNTMNLCSKHEHKTKKLNDKFLKSNNHLISRCIIVFSHYKIKVDNTKPNTFRPTSKRNNNEPKKKSIKFLDTVVKNTAPRTTNLIDKINNKLSTNNVNGILSSNTDILNRASDMKFLKSPSKSMNVNLINKNNQCFRECLVLEIIEETDYRFKEVLSSLQDEISKLSLKKTKKDKEKRKNLINIMKEKLYFEDQIERMPYNTNIVNTTISQSLSNNKEAKESKDKTKRRISNKRRNAQKKSSKTVSNGLIDRIRMKYKKGYFLNNKEQEYNSINTTLGDRLHKRNSSSVKDLTLLSRFNINTSHKDSNNEFDNYNNSKSKETISSVNIESSKKIKMLDNKKFSFGVNMLNELKRNNSSNNSIISSKFKDNKYKEENKTIDNSMIINSNTDNKRNVIISNFDNNDCNDNGYVGLDNEVNGFINPSVNNDRQSPNSLSHGFKEAVPISSKIKVSSNPNNIDSNKSNNKELTHIKTIKKPNILNNINNDYSKINNKCSDTSSFNCNEDNSKDLNKEIETSYNVKDKNFIETHDHRDQKSKDLISKRLEELKARLITDNNNTTNNRFLHNDKSVSQITHITDKSSNVYRKKKKKRKSSSKRSKSILQQSYISYSEIKPQNAFNCSYLESSMKLEKMHIKSNKEEANLNNKNATNSFLDQKLIDSMAVNNTANNNINNKNNHHPNNHINNQEIVESSNKFNYSIQNHKHNTNNNNNINNNATISSNDNISYDNHINKDIKSNKFISIKNRKEAHNKSNSNDYDYFATLYNQNSSKKVVNVLLKRISNNLNEKENIINKEYNNFNMKTKESYKKDIKLTPSNTNQDSIILVSYNNPYEYLTEKNKLNSSNSLTTIIYNETINDKDDNSNLNIVKEISSVDREAYINENDKKNNINFKRSSKKVATTLVNSRMSLNKKPTLKNLKYNNIEEIIRSNKNSRVEIKEDIKDKNIIVSPSSKPIESLYSSYAKNNQKISSNKNVISNSNRINSNNDVNNKNNNNENQVFSNRYNSENTFSFNKDGKNNDLLINYNLNNYSSAFKGDFSNYKDKDKKSNEIIEVKEVVEKKEFNSAINIRDNQDHYKISHSYSKKDIKNETPLLTSSSINNNTLDKHFYSKFTSYNEYYNNYQQFVSSRNNDTTENNQQNTNSQFDKNIICSNAFSKSFSNNFHINNKNNLVSSSSNKEGNFISSNNNNNNENNTDVNNSSLKKLIINSIFVNSADTNSNNNNENQQSKSSTVKSGYFNSLNCNFKNLLANNNLTTNATNATNKPKHKIELDFEIIENAHKVEDQIDSPEFACKAEGNLLNTKTSRINKSKNTTNKTEKSGISLLTYNITSPINDFCNYNNRNNDIHVSVKDLKDNTKNSNLNAMSNSSKESFGVKNQINKPTKTNTSTRNKNNNKTDSISLIEQISFETNNNLLFSSLKQKRKIKNNNNTTSHNQDSKKFNSENKLFRLKRKETNNSKNSKNSYEINEEEILNPTINKNITLKEIIHYNKNKNKDNSNIISYSNLNKPTTKDKISAINNIFSQINEDNEENFETKSLCNDINYAIEKERNLKKISISPIKKERKEYNIINYESDKDKDKYCKISYNQKPSYKGFNLDNNKEEERTFIDNNECKEEQNSNSGLNIDNEKILEKIQTIEEDQKLKSSNYNLIGIRENCNIKGINSRLKELKDLNLQFVRDKEEKKISTDLNLKIFSKMIKIKNKEFKNTSKEENISLDDIPTTKLIKHNAFNSNSENIYENNIFINKTNKEELSHNCNNTAAQKPSIKESIIYSNSKNLNFINSNTKDNKENKDKYKLETMTYTNDKKIPEKNNNKEMNLNSNKNNSLINNNSKNNINTTSTKEFIPMSKYQIKHVDEVKNKDNILIRNNKTNKNNGNDNKLKDSIPIPKNNKKSFLLKHTKIIDSFIENQKQQLNNNNKAEIKKTPKEDISFKLGINNIQEKTMLSKNESNNSNYSTLNRLGFLKKSLLNKSNK